MKRILASTLQHHEGKKVRVRGWLHTIRPLGKLNFVIIRDKSGLIQVVVEEKEEIKKLSSCQPGTIVEVVGEVHKSLQADLGVEIIHPKMRVEVAVTATPPVEYYKPKIPSDLEFILDHRAIALRNREIQAVFKVQAELTHAFRLYMHDVAEAVEYFGPNILGASSEGGAEFFTVDYFGHTATLAQSSQLYKQVMVGVNERVFALMPFFRAEKSNTTRHLSEGKQFEFEMGFFDHWHEILDEQEACLKFMIEHVEKTCAKEIELLGGSMVKAPKDIPFPRLTFAQAQELYFSRTGIDERQETDLSPAAERELCKYAKESFGTDFIFITDWLAEKRPFYAYKNDENPHLTDTFDLLCAGSEITSGGRRANTYESMIAGIKSKGMDPECFTDYLSIFKYGMPPHGGFGMGLERLTMMLLGLKNIREASLFPSDPKRIAGARLKAKVFFGGENIRNEIIRLLKEGEIPFSHLKHAQTLSSEESAKERGTSLQLGVKSLILRGKSTKKNYQFNLLADGKIDMKAVADLVGEKCDFEKPEVLLERFGLEVGGVPPFGFLLNIETYFTEEILSKQEIAFNCGLPTESIVVSAKGVVDIVQPKIGQFTKSSGEL